MFQAYTTGLEIEIAHLQKENAKLRRQQEKVLPFVHRITLLLAEC